MGLGLGISLVLHLVLVSGVLFVFGSQRKIQPLPVPIQVSVGIESGSPASSESASSESPSRPSNAVKTKRSVTQAPVPPPQENPAEETNPPSASPLIEEASPQANPQTDASDAATPVPSPNAKTSNEAPTGFVSTQASDGESTGAADTEKALIAAYQSKLSRLIDAAKLYPRAAREQGLEGRAVVSFSLAKDGGFLTPPRIETSSGFRQLDQAALNAVGTAITSARNSGGSLKFDPGVNAESLDFRISIVFTLQ